MARRRKEDEEGLGLPGLENKPLPGSQLSAGLGPSTGLGPQPVAPKTGLEQKKRRRPGSFRRAFGFLIALLLSAAIIGGAVVLATHKTSKHNVTSSAASVPAVPSTPTVSATPTTPTVTSTTPVKPATPVKHFKVTSKTTLLRTASLRKVLSRLQAKLDPKILVVDATLTAGKLRLVIADGVDARTVVATAAGAVTIGDPGKSLQGAQAIELGQIHSTVPARLAALVRKHHGGHLTKLTLDTAYKGEEAGWKLTTTSKRHRYSALLDGSAFKTS